MDKNQNEKISDITETNDSKCENINTNSVKENINPVDKGNEQGNEEIVCEEIKEEKTNDSETEKHTDVDTDTDVDTKSVEPTENNEPVQETVTETPTAQKHNHTYQIIAGGLCILLIATVLFSKFHTPNTSATAKPATPPIQVDISSQEHANLDSDAMHKSDPIIIDGNKVIDFTETIEKVLPSIVSISNLNTPHEPDFNGADEEGWTIENELNSAASGVIIGDNGKEIWIVTNAHVIANAHSLMVSFCDDTKVSAYVKGSFDDTDLAVISVKIKDINKQTLDKIAKIEIGDSSKLKMGQNIVAIGNALGYGQSSTTGIVSAVNRKITTEMGNTLTAIQIDAPINPGNSGGALVNLKGELIGIPTAKSSSTYVEGMGFAIPINDVKEKIEVLCAKESRVYATDENAVTLGINVTDTLLGAMVVNIEPNTLAYDSELCVGDIIEGFNDMPSMTSEKVTNALRFCKKGETITLNVSRPNGKEFKNLEIKITL